MEIKKQSTSKWIKEQALALGYDNVGFSHLNISKNDQINLTKFAKEAEAGTMSWFSRHLKLRKNPKELLAEAKSAIVLASYYRSLEGEEILKNAKVKIARYAHGNDYHKFLRKKAKKLIAVLKQNIPNLNTRICIDSAPVPEKILGQMAGLGWQGKNTNLIHPKLGSYFFLSVILVDIELSLSTPIVDHCKNCQLCIDACPTQALSKHTPYRINSQSCISYLNIEHRNEVPEQLKESFEKWAFGCDICQSVCPYNRNRQIRKKNTKEEEFKLKPNIYDLMQKAQLPENINWDEWSKGLAIRRVNLKKMKNNLAIAKASSNCK